MGEKIWRWVTPVGACVIGVFVGIDMWAVSHEWWLSATLGGAVAWVWNAAFGEVFEEK